MAECIVINEPEDPEIWAKINRALETIEMADLIIKHNTQIVSGIRERLTIEGFNPDNYGPGTPEDYLVAFDRMVEQLKLDNSQSRIINELNSENNRYEEEASRLESKIEDLEKKITDLSEEIADLEEEHKDTRFKV